MLIISSREFREKQKKYLDLVDKKEQVIVQRGKNKAYVLVPVTDIDRFFADPKVRKRLIHSIAQAEREEVTPLAKEDINKFLGV